MKFAIDKYVIDSPIDSIIDTIKKNTRYCHDVKKTKTNIVVTCPFHKNGNERTPSCSINAVDDIDVPYGAYHCWSCGARGNLTKFVTKCLETNTKIAEDWLVSNFSNSLITQVDILPFIDEKPTQLKEVELSDDFLSDFEYDNQEALEYLIVKRKLSVEVINYFKIGYDPPSDSITFPIWDEYGRLVGISRRNLHTKYFSFPKLNNKPVYLLDTIKRFGYDTLYITESQINALTLWGWRFPAVALFGTGSNYQYKLLNKCGVKNVVLCLDGDVAGRSGIRKLLNALSKDIIITVVKIPDGKDVNDLTKEEFRRLPRFDRNDWQKFLDKTNNS